MTRIVPLGTNGFFPANGRQTMAFLVLTERQALLLDAGTGISRMIEPAVVALLRPFDSLDVILSHYHLDHVIGLSYMPAAWNRGRVRVFGPADPLVEGDPKTALDQLLTVPLFPARYQTFPAPLDPIAVREERFSVGELEVRLRRQSHPGGSVGIRIGDEIAYLTDTAADAAAVDFVRGARILLHELWETDEEAAQAEKFGHSHFSGLAGFVRSACVPVVMPVHHHPRRSGPEVRALCERLGERAGVGVIFPDEGKVFELDAL